MLAEICLENIREYAYHGCLPEEAIIGTEYRIDVTCWVDISKAIASDELVDAADYVLIQQIISTIMKNRCQLLERVVANICDQILLEIPLTEKVDVRVSKLNPPINGETSSVSLRLVKNREVI